MTTAQPERQPLLGGEARLVGGEPKKRIPNFFYLNLETTRHTPR